MLEVACSALPKASLRAKCLSAIENETGEILDLIIKEVTPKEVCIALGMCHVGVSTAEVIETNEKPDSPPCRLCQIVAAKIEEQLNNKTAQEDVEKCVKQICNSLPSKLQPQCRQFIDEYANEIIKHFPSGSPKELCKKICVCPSANTDELSEGKFKNYICYIYFGLNI